MPLNTTQSYTKKIYPSIIIFIGISICLFTLDTIRADILNSARAYIAGESLWSKAQKDATHYLMRYSTSHDETDYQAFLKALTVLFGDSRARIELEKPEPDLEIVYEGFIAGGNHPEDVKDMAVFFRRYRHNEHMARPIAIWTEADRQISALLELANTLHTLLSSGAPEPDRIPEIRMEVETLDQRLSQLEKEFSSALGAASRWINAATQQFINLAVLLLLSLGTAISVRMIRSVSRTEQARMASEARFRRVVESNMIGILFGREDGTIVEANEAFLQLVGYTRREARASALNWKNMTPPEYADRDLQARNELTATRACTPYEKEFIRKDGHRVAVYFGAAHLESGEESEVCFVLDMTQRKQAKEALRQAHQLLDGVVNHTHLLMACLDTDFNFIWVNQAYAQAGGHEPEFFPGKNHFVLYPYADNEAIFRRVVETGSPCFFEAKPFEYKDQPERGVTYWNWGLIPIKDTAGKVERLVFTLLDVTAHVRTEQALHKADQRKNEFLAMLGHELRNPLAPIRNAVQVMRKSGALNPKLEWATDMIDRQVSHLTRLVDDLLDISRVTQGKITLRKEPVDLAAIALQAVEAIRPVMIERRHSLTLVLPGSPLYLTGDRVRLAQIIDNLLTNAAKYSENGGQIRVTLEQADREAVLRVRDRGIGIPEEALPHIFELFTQLNPGLDRAQGGLGIGLSLVTKLVDMHGGRIEAHSEGPGLGSEFVVHFPLLTQEIEPILPPYADTSFMLESSETLNECA